MEKKFTFSDKPKMTKIIYAAVIAILCVTAIVVGIVSAASKAKDNEPLPTPPDNTDNGGNENVTPEPPPVEEKQTFISPVAGAVTVGHSLEVPVFSLTLGEWRMHTGVDIACEEGAPVFASSEGVISGIFSDPMLGYTIEITHPNDIKTRYSNLKNEVGELKVGDTVEAGERIGTVGESALGELADEAHLHFEVLLKDVKVNPLDYIEE